MRRLEIAQNLNSYTVYDDIEIGGTDDFSINLRRRFLDPNFIDVLKQKVQNMVILSSKLNPN